VRRLFGLRQRFNRLPILNRLLIGNSAVIVVGAVGGTLLIHYLTSLQVDADLPLIGLFASLGILLSLLVNYWIVKAALRPLHELREAVDRVQARPGGAPVSLASDADPDLSRLAAAISSMLERVEGRTVQLRALSERAINAQEEERKRIARGLHDGIGQDLSMLIINLERMEGVVPADAPDVQRQLAVARQSATRTLEELREVVYGLRPTMLDDLGLGPAIRWYARSNLEEARIRVKFEVFDETMRLPPELETTLFRIAQEAINNIVHHADAKSVVIRLSREDGHIGLHVEDNGRGFDVANITGQALRLRRFGLMGIQERAELVGGEVTLDSIPGRGTAVHVRVPLLGWGNCSDGKNPDLAGG
jgi:two-component system, NarL family, sensor histidine kinase UhpB